MKISISGMLYALSTALDCVESEVFGVTTYHSKRVAYMCAKIGGSLGYPRQKLSMLAGTAVMHDNALTEYIAIRRLDGDFKNIEASQLAPHCTMGEKNMSFLPFYTEVKNAVLYHHENADASGPFGKKTDETPVFAQIIHIADQVDNMFDLSNITEEKYNKLMRWLDKKRNVLFETSLVDVFKKSISFDDIKSVEGGKISEILSSTLPVCEPEYSDDEIIAFASLFARITDYKSHFTSTHSTGIAAKARKMGIYYKKSSDECTKLYLAGALHDIGKLTIPNEILEKPDKLSEEEFEVMKTHAYASYMILKDLTDIPDVVSWACMHHEKLDSSGYPFGKGADELGKNERLLCCIDIYQALTEDRPYKAGMTHKEAVAIMWDMAENGKIDADITKDIDKCFSHA